ncbi:HIGD1A [Bugula neritina]|uniref:HIGD1A n=1 Tax=Bugula neritina TaxID=10212 RepID=A0A7J7KTU8_BUGNE|nr:HIGD1A [Bugula neritina]
MADHRNEAMKMRDIPKDESRLSKMMRKIKKDPAVVVGMTGWTGLVGYGLYNIRKRKTSLSLYLIHLRVTAQVFAIGCMVSVVGYRIFNHEKNRFFGKSADEE